MNDFIRLASWAPGMTVALVLAATLSGCSGMGLSSPPMERDAINGMEAHLNAARQAFYQQFHRQPRGFTEITTTDLMKVNATKVDVGHFGTYAGETPCQVSQRQIVCTKTFSYYNNVRYAWGNPITVTGDPGHISPPLKE